MHAYRRAKIMSVYFRRCVIVVKRYERKALSVHALVEERALFPLKSVINQSFLAKSHPVRYAVAALCVIVPRHYALDVSYRVHTMRCTTILRYRPGCTFAIRSRATRFLHNRAY